LNKTPFDSFSQVIEQFRSEKILQKNLPGRIQMHAWPGWQIVVSALIIPSEEQGKD
jgi:hypothetical protein